MKKHPLLNWAVMAIAIAASTPTLNAVTNVWSGASLVDTNWSTAGNWNPSGQPNTNDTARFVDTGAAGDAVTINNVVASSRTIRSLWIGQSNGFQNMLITAGATLTVTGTNDNGWGPLGSNPGQVLPDPASYNSTIYVGTKTAVSVTVNATISGNGTLVASNANNEINVRQTNPSATGTRLAILNMSGLDTFIARLGRIRVGDGEDNPLNRCQAQMFLAKTNNITLTGTNVADNVQLLVGNNDVNANGTTTLVLGQQNTLSLDEMIVGGSKQVAFLRFTNTFTNPSLILRASDGSGRTRAVRVGDESEAQATGTATTGTMNLTDGTSDILADRITVGKSQNGNNTALATGNLLVGSGTINANTLELGVQANSAYGGTVTGTASFSNATVTVNTLLQLGRSIFPSLAPRVANLNINGGSMTVNGSYKNDGTVNINVTNATLTLPAGSSVTARTLQLDGATLVNAANVTVTNALNIYNNGSIAGAPVFDLGNIAAPPTWDVTGISGGSLNVSNALQGKGTINGNVVQATGATVTIGGANSAGTLSVNGNMTLNAGTLRFDLATNASLTSDQLTVSGTATLNGTNDVIFTALGGSFDTNNQYTLITSGTLIGNQTYFKPAGPLALSRYTFTFDTSTVLNNVRLTVAGTGAKNLTWVGDGTVNLWNAQGAANWNDGVGSSAFFSLDNVIISDSGSASPAISMSGSLIPGSMTVNNTSKAYGLGGTGALSVSGSLTKSGTNSLTFTNSAGNSFSSVVAVQGGAVTFANNGQNTFSGGVNLTGGSLVLAGNSSNVFLDTGVPPVITVGTGTTLSIVNSNANTFNGVQVQVDGTLAFGQPIDVLCDSGLTSTGTLTKTNIGKLTLSGNSASFSGAVQINGGTIRAGSSTSPLGVGSVTVTNTGALDINGSILGSIPVVVSGSGPTGAGALVNFGGPQDTTLTGTAKALQSVTLSNNATFGGSGPWNTDPIQNVGYFAVAGTLSTAGSAYNLTKVGSNQLSLISATVDIALADINVQQGLLNLQGTTTSLGNPSNNITIQAGAQVSFYNTTTLWDKNFFLIGNGVTPNLLNYSNVNTIIGAVSLSGNCVLGAVDFTRGTPVLLVLNGPVIGTGSVTKTGGDTTVLGGTNTYSGTTTISSGTLAVNGVNRGPGAITATGGTLGGTGIIHSPAIVQSGGTLAPGNTNTPTGTLTISNTLSLAGTTVMDVTKSGTDFTADLVTNVTSLTYGGQLQLNLAGDPLAAGDAIKLFSFNSATLGFSSISPATPGAGLVWNTSTLTTDGKIRVAAAPAAQPHFVSATISNGKIILTGTNGTDSGNYYVLASTNLSLALSNWTPIGTDAFVSGNFNFTNNVDPTTPRRFYMLQLP